MAVLHENPDLQQGLIDAAADTTSAAVVAPLTFGTYFTLSGDVSIDSDTDDSHSAESRHRNLNSFFNDEEDNESSPSGGEEVEHETGYGEENQSEEELPLDTFFLPPLSDSRFFLRHRGDTKSLHHPKLLVKSQLMALTPTAISSGPFTIPPMTPLRGSEVRSVRRTAKSRIQWTLTNG
jgi:hypothetical protein